VGWILCLTNTLMILWSKRMSAWLMNLNTPSYYQETEKSHSHTWLVCQLNGQQWRRKNLLLEERSRCVVSLFLSMCASVLLIWCLYLHIGIMCSPKTGLIWILTGFIYCSTEFGASRRSLNFSILGWVQRIVCITWILWKTKYCFKKTNRMNEVFFVFFL